jgi:hypothetical protein
MFLTVTSMSILLELMWVGTTLGILSSMSGHVQIWFGLINFFLSVPFITLVMSLVVAGAWATGEGQAYIVWPQHLLRPFSAVMRGHLRTPEAAFPVTAGYAAAFVALGVATAIGLVTPAAENASVAPLRALGDWPVSLSAPLQGLSLGLSITVTSGVFAMTYARLRTRRIWIVVLVGALVALSMRVTFWPQQYFPGSKSVALAVVVALAVGLSVVFVRFGPLASLTACFVYLVAVTSYPLVLSGNPGHARSGAWSLVLGLVPAAIATWGVLRPREDSKSSIGQSHVDRFLRRIRVAEEFDIARRIQTQYLPAFAPHVPGLDISFISLPAHECGGDFYAFSVRDGTFAAVIGDVSGKGISAAMYSTMMIGYWITQESLADDPVRLASLINRRLARNVEPGSFVTAAFVAVDVVRRSVAYARAGHNWPILAEPDGAVTFLKAPGLGLGVANAQMFDMVTRAEHTPFAVGQVLALYSDGVTEAKNPEGDEYSEERLASVVGECVRRGDSSEAIIKAVLKSVAKFRRGAPPHDDVSLVVIRSVAD